jgi:hypothetical protein
VTEQFRPPGDRSVIVGRDVINSIIVTGDHNRFFIGHYERLRDAYIRPWSVFERVKLDRFVGREWLTAEIDAFLRDEERGYFVLEAGAGLGKTTFLAHLVKERGYIHHFAELAPGPTGIAPGLKNLAAQLVRVWGLDPLAEGVLPGAASRPDFLQDLLAEAARKRNEVRPDEKIVLVVDALDEAGTVPGQNVLGLPQVLPAGIYFLVSQRPVAVALRVEGPSRVFHLEAEGGKNVADMLAYLEAAVTWPGVAHTLEEGGYTQTQFVETMLHKCRGIWVYLHYIVGEIERGERSPLDLAVLPNDVWQYYAQYWRRWQKGDKQEEADWYGEVLPLLGTLAAAQEALSMPLLCTLAGVAERPELRRLLREEWRPFLALEKTKASQRYRLYHASLREFLDGKAQLTRMKEAERSLAEELVDATRQAHSRIADRYLVGAWGELEDRLPGLKDPAKRDVDDRYGVRHLAAHLEGSRRVDELHRLLSVEWFHQEEEHYSRPGWRGLMDRLLRRQRVRMRTHLENAWYEAHAHVGDTLGYLGDVARAWRLARETSERRILQGKPAPSVGLEIRYALLTASINSQVRNVPAALLTALVEGRVWTPIQGLAYARKLPDSKQRAEALAGLASHLPESLRNEALREALAAVGKIGGHRAGGGALGGMIHQLPESLLQEALDASRTIKDADTRAELIAWTALRLQEPLGTGAFQEALEAARAIQDAEARARVLTELAPHQPDLLEPLLQEALAAARAIEPEAARVEVLTRLTSLLPEPLRNKALDEAFTAAQAIGSDWFSAWDQAEALAGLAPYLQEPLLQKVLAAAWELPELSIHGLSPQVEVLTALAPRLPEGQREKVLQTTLTRAQRLPKRHSMDRNPRARALARLAPLFSEPLRSKILKETLAAARAIKADDTWAGTLARLAPELTESMLQGALQQARRLHATDAFGDESPRAEALTALAPHLPEPLRQEAMKGALAAVRAIFDHGFRAGALVELAPYLSEPLLREALEAALELVPEFASEVDSPRTEALVGLTPYLPEPLLREALAAMDAIGDDWSRAMALARLLPQLGALGHPAEALLAAQDLPERFYSYPVKSTVRGGPRLQVQLEYAPAVLSPRPETLVRLAPGLPEALRDEVLRETLARLRPHRIQLWFDSGSYHRSRLLTLIGLIPHLPERERNEILPKALAAAKAIAYMDCDTWALVELAPYLPDPLLQKALAAVQNLPESVEDDEGFGRRHPQAQALAVLAPRLAELGHAQEALTTAQAMEQTDWRALALTGLLPHLPEAEREDALREALAAVQAIEEVHVRREALTKMAPHLPESSTEEALAATWELPGQDQAEVLAGLAPRLAELNHPQEAVTMARAIEGRGYRALALARLATRLTGPSRDEILREALSAVRTTADADVRSEGLIELAPHLAALPIASFYLHWCETLPILATRTRRDLLSDICALESNIAPLGGAAAVRETCHAIQDVGRWWP